VANILFSIVRDHCFEFYEMGEITSAYKFIYNGYYYELLAYSTLINFVKFLYQ